MSRLFGTDGVRGVAGKELTSELAMNIGKALGYILNRTNSNNVVLIGSDTRVSKDMLVSGISSGLCSLGIDIINVGIISTPAISYLINKYKANAGVMITASHNPYQYNGIKIFDSNGYKLDDNLEDEIQELINNQDKLIINNKIGKITNESKAIDEYIEHLIKIKTEDYSNLKVCIDTSNGSASVSAPILFSKLGCKYEIINKDYDGFNINKDCGSTHIEILQEYIKKKKFDLGIAFDGDADRCMLVDNEGNVRDGDYILALTSKYLKDKNILSKNTVVGTVMSNLGFIKYCDSNNINFISTKVGDRYVLEEMLLNSYNLGGEQSGHIIFKDYANTGDGQLTAIMIMNIISYYHKSLKELSEIMNKYPQVMVNVEISNDKKNEFYTNSKIQEEIHKLEATLKDNGRVLVRPSGTEPLIRVMIEGQDKEIITKYANSLADYIKDNL